VQVPLIFALKGNALDDGPGIRTTVFFKGCALSCAWCHNPEGRRRDAELAWSAEVCVDDGSCLHSCERDALVRALPSRIDRERCDLCEDCVAVCPSGALTVVGERWTIDALLAAIVVDQPFFDASGGGVTLSGGEPGLYPEYAGELAQRLRQAGIHVLLETAGAWEPRRFHAHLYDHLDAIYFDLKLLDAAMHRRWCGADNRQILENFERLFARSRDGGVPVLPRVPLIPGVTATPENLDGLAGFLREQGCNQVALLPYHPTWRDKAVRMDIPVDPALPRRFMDEDAVAECRARFEGFGIIG